MANEEESTKEESTMAEDSEDDDDPPTPKTRNGSACVKKAFSEEQTKNGSTTHEKSHSSGLYFLAIVGCLVVVLLSISPGVMTPPLIQGAGKKPMDLIKRKLFTMPQSRCDQEALSHFLHENPVPGMHVVCVEPCTSCGAGGLTMELFPGAQQIVEPQVRNMLNVLPADDTEEVTWSAVRNSLMSELSLRKSDDLHQPWAIYSPVGERIVAENDVLKDPVVKSLLDSGMFLIFQGGQWLWPGVRVGFNRSVDLYTIMPEEDWPPRPDLPTEKRTVTLETLSLKPLVLSVEGFLSEEECDLIQEKATPNLRYSSVTLTDADKGKDAAEFRTSQSTFLRHYDSNLLDIEYRTASLVRVPRMHQEHVQVLRYGLTERYLAHHDYFNPEFYQQDPYTLQLIQNGRRNRLATVFWYLSDVPQGGETVFPRWNGAPEPSDFGDCTVGLKVKPQRGKVIIFYSLLPDGELDPLSLHGACAVKEGVKFAANKWVWNQPMPYLKTRRSSMAS